jgi:hypothetical protein
MDEKAMTEQDLREEQLQQITGGCGECATLATERDIRLDQAADARWLAEGHAARGAHRAAQRATGWANYFTKVAKEYQGQIDVKRGTAGHPPAGGGSSNAVPDLNRLRLH